MERTDLLDTSIKMRKLRILMLREKSPSWKLQKTLELCDGMSVLRETTKQYRTGPSK